MIINKIIASILKFILLLLILILSAALVFPLIVIIVSLATRDEDDPEHFIMAMFKSI